MPELQLMKIEKTLGNRQFLYDFRLSGSRIVAISGKSGSGKSTLFHLIAGFETPDSGRVLIDGADITPLQSGERPLTYIFQEYNLFAHLNVFDNTALGISPTLRLSHSQRQSVEIALEKVGLAGFGKRHVQDLSGGERQRAAFARALLRRRPVLLLDEAFASLDEDLRTSLGKLLSQLQQEHEMLVLLISHDRAEIQRLAEEVVVIEEGRNTFQGTVDQWRELAQ